MTSRPVLTVAQATGSVLAGYGVETAFGLVGSGNFVVTNSLMAGGCHFIAARHESSAVCMADGYARVTGKVGVVTVHQGPGVTNALTGLTESAKAHTSLLLIAGDTSESSALSNFRVDQESLAGAVGAHVERVTSAGEVLKTVSRAYHRALHDNQAVVLLLPLDVQESHVPDGEPPTVPKPTAILPSSDAVDRVIDEILVAERPVVLAGRGGVVSNGRDEIVKVADAIGALLATSANAHGLFSGHPYSLGISGGFASPRAVELLSEADLVIGFGLSLNRWTTRNGRIFNERCRFVQIDSDPEAIGKHRPVDVGVVADVRLTAQALVAGLNSRDVSRVGGRGPGAREAVATSGHRHISFRDRSTATTVDPRSFTLALNERLPQDRAIAVDSGHFSGWPVMYLDVPGPREFIFNQAFQSVGVGLGAAIGASVARQSLITVAAVGDGGFYMSLGDVDTAVRYRLPLMILVYNDHAYGAEVHHFEPAGHDLSSVSFPDSDIAAIGRALGCSGTTIRSPSDLSDLDPWLNSPDGPIVVDVKVEPTVVGEWLPEAFLS